MFLIWSLLSCGSSLSCGPGTLDIDGICLPERVGSTGGGTTDSGSTDAGTTDSGTTDSGTTDGGTTDGGTDGGTDSGTTDGGTDTGISAPDTRVWLLAGQSNMVGIGQVTGLPPSLQVGQDDVQIFWSGSPSWRPLEPSSGYSSGSARYTGPETSFGRTLADALADALSDTLADTEVRLIKHAVGGTDLAVYWSPGESRDDAAQGDGYRDWLATVDAGLAALDEAGTTYEIAGMIWMQGESDATDPVWAKQYSRNLSHLIERVRADVSVPALPFAIGLIDCEGLCVYRETVRTTQQTVADADSQVFIVETEDLGLYPSDHWHYQGLGQRVLGERFAQVLLGESIATMPTAAVTLTGRYDYSYTGDFVVGWRFTIHSAITVTDVGVFDLGDNGLAHTSQVAIWDTDTESLLTLETVPAWDEADTTLLDGFRTVGVEPLVLEPGDYIIGDQSFDTNFDDYVYNAVIETGAALSWTEGRHAVGSAIAFPTTVVAGTDAGAAWFGPNFRYREL